MCQKTIVATIMQQQIATENNKMWMLGFSNSTGIFTSSMFQFTCPKLKRNKTKQIMYSTNFEQDWYKIPYKYDMCLEFCLFVPNDAPVPTITASFEMVYQDYTALQMSEMDLPPCTLTNVQMLVVKQQHGYYKYEAKCTGFHFNVCSYNHSGKHFCLRIHFFSQQQQEDLAILTSPSFLIRAKKPIAKAPSTVAKKRGRKRKRPKKEEEDDVEEVQADSENEMEEVQANKRPKLQHDENASATTTTTSTSSVANNFVTDGSPEITNTIALLAPQTTTTPSLISPKPLSSQELDDFLKQEVFGKD